MQIPLKSQDGITLLTQKKYCGENINIIPELQTKETTFSNADQSITPDPGYAGLKEVKVNAIPDFDKYVRTDKENTFTETQIFEEPILVPNTAIIEGSQVAVNADTLKKALDNKRDIVPIPSSGTRFYVASTSGQGYAEGTTSANKKYDVVQRADNAQIKAPNQLTFPPLDDEYISRAYANNNYLQKTGGNITGSLSLTRDLTVGGNLTVNGTTTTVESTTLQVKDKLIEVAQGNTSPLTTPAGIVVPNYNGNDSGAMVFDNTGTAYVGDVTLDVSGNIDVGKSHLQPLATRNLSSANDGQLVKWDESNKTLVGSGKAVDDISTATNIENGSGTNTLQQTPARPTFINTIVGYTKNDPEGSTAGADAYGPYVDPVIYNATDNTTTTVNSGVNSIMFGGLSHNEGGAPTTVRPDYTGDASQSFIAGRRNINIGDYNSVFNTDNIIYGDNCFVSGLRNISVANKTTVMGTGLIATKLGQVVLGRYNIPDNNAAFILGGGWQQQHKDGTNPDGSNKYVLDSITRKTLFKINENGDTYVNGHLNVSLAPVDSGDVVRLQELNGKLDKLTPKTNSILYGLTPEGRSLGFETGTTNIFRYAIPQRTVNGQIAMPNQVTYAPTDDQVITKRFADNNYEKLRTPLFTGEFLYEISKSTTGTIQRSLHGYGVTAKPSSIVKRTTKGQIELPDQTASAPTDDQAISKGYADANYLKGALPTVGTSTSSKDLKKIIYTAESDIPATPEEGVEYAVVGFVGYSDLDSNLQEKIDNVPTWKTTAPTTDADKKKVQFTKVIISTTDDTNFPGMNGRYAIVPGFTNDGFHYGTVVCSQADPAYEFPFIGSITSEMASGTVIKPSVSPTYVSVVNPQVTFTYEYLW